MARICGVDIDGKEARMVLLDGTVDEFSIIDNEFKRISLNDHQSQDDVRSFVATFQAFLNDANVDLVAIKSRAVKGRGRGGVLTFKIEGLIQMMKQDVVLFSPQTLSSKLKKAGIELKEVSILAYQREAYSAAYIGLQKKSSQ